MQTHIQADKKNMVGIKKHSTITPYKSRTTYWILELSSKNTQAMIFMHERFEEELPFH